MFITGLGIGPAFAVFTLVVQNSVPMEELGAGTSSLTLFQQVGGTVGLAITGHALHIGPAGGGPEPARGRPACPRSSRDAFAAGGATALNQLTGVGDLGAAILAQVPPEFQAQVEPLIPAIVGAIHTSFSIATGATFVVGIVAASWPRRRGPVGMPNTRMREMAEQRPESAAPQLEPATD